MSKTISFVVDTNLFFECRVLDEIPWADLGYDEIELLVTQPVQSEIDKHKKNTNGRTHGRALRFFKLFRKMITESRCEVIKSESPRVTLSFAVGVRPDKSHEGHLDYSKNDDALVGCLSELNKDDHKTYALLTHDTGPMLTSQSLDLKCEFIPESWLLPQQENSQTKEVKKLKNEIKRLQSQEPQIEIELRDSTDEIVSRLDFERTICTALTDEQINELLRRIEQRFPEDRDFGFKDTIAKPDHLISIPLINTADSFHAAIAP